MTLCIVDEWKEIFCNEFALLPDDVQNNLLLRPALGDWINPKVTVLFLELLKLSHHRRVDEILTIIDRVDTDELKRTRLRKFVWQIITKRQSKGVVCPCSTNARGLSFSALIDRQSNYWDRDPFLEGVL